MSILETQYSNNDSIGCKKPLLNLGVKKYPTFRIIQKIAIRVPGSIHPTKSSDFSTLVGSSDEENLPARSFETVFAPLDSNGA